VLDLAVLHRDDDVRVRAAAEQLRDDTAQLRHEHVSARRHGVLWSRIDHRFLLRYHTVAVTPIARPMTTPATIGTKRPAVAAASTEPDRMTKRASLAPGSGMSIVPPSGSWSVRTFPAVRLIVHRSRSRGTSPTAAASRAIPAAVSCRA